MSDSEEINWGDPIEVSGKCPDWLIPPYTLKQTYDRDQTSIIRAPAVVGDWSRVTSIRLPVDHPHYAIAAQTQGNPLPGLPTTITVDRAEYTALLNQVADLARRRDDLLAANNELVEQRREASQRALRNAGEFARACQERDAAVARASRIDEIRNNLANALNRMIDRWQGQREEIEALRSATPETPKYSPTETEGQWAFGPWVECVGSHPCFPVGADYQHSVDGVAAIDRLKSKRDQARPWNPGKVRRAYRIGEWYDHDGSAEVMLEAGTVHDWVPTWGDHPYTDCTEPGDSAWRNVKRFRPTAAAPKQEAQ